MRSAPIKPRTNRMVRLGERPGRIAEPRNEGMSSFASLSDGAVSFSARQLPDEPRVRAVRRRGRAQALEGLANDA